MSLLSALASDLAKTPAIPGAGDTFIGMNPLASPRPEWLLVGRLMSELPITETPLLRDPFTIGRHPKNDLALTYPTVSGYHAEIGTRDGQLWVNDLGSTNGTFLNGHKLSAPEILRAGDVLQFGTAVFTLKPTIEQPNSQCRSTISADAAREAMAQMQFERLLNDPAVTPHYQPIVRLADRKTIGYEVLARSELLGLESPATMFRIAHQRGQEAALSQILRREGLRQWLRAGVGGELYLNTHPVELRQPELLPSLEELRTEFPHWSLVLEVHEAAVAGIRDLADLRRSLQGLGIRLAYDDFGSGQSRLNELIEVPPDVLKFDMHLIRGLSKAPTERRRLIESLVRGAHDFQVTALAEGVETEDDAQACLNVGFDLAQGYYFGYPAPASTWQF
jgi:EAL domain-containing protein (putative c-di-GMP-specific phosphodiesterase class I)